MLASLAPVVLVAAGGATEPVPASRPTVSAVDPTVPAHLGPDPTPLVEWQGQLVFLATHPDHVHRRLFVTTPGSAAVREVLTPAQQLAVAQIGSRPHLVAEAGGRLYTVAAPVDRDQQTGRTQLWATDVAGLPAAQLTTFPTDPGNPATSPQIRDLVTVGDDLYFTVRTAGDWQLWRSDGTPEGTVLVQVLPRYLSAVTSLTAVGDRLYFLYGGEQDEHESAPRWLWTSDGTTEGTRAVGGGLEGRYVSRLTAMDDLLVASVSMPDRRVLALVDGADGIEVIYDPLRDGGGGGIASLDRDDGTLYFTLQRAATPGGTVQIWRWAPGARAAAVSDWLAVGRVWDAAATSGRYYVAGSPSGTGADKLVMFSEDTRAATLVRDFASGTPGGYISRGLVGLDGWVFFPGGHETNGWEVWASDGTTAGTDVLGVGSLSGPAHCDEEEPVALTAVAGALYFVQQDGCRGMLIWRVGVQPLPVLTPPAVVTATPPAASDASGAPTNLTHPVAESTADHRLTGLTVRASRFQRQFVGRIRVVLHVGVGEAASIEASATLRVGAKKAGLLVSTTYSEPTGNSSRKVVLTARGAKVRQFMSRVRDSRSPAPAFIAVRASDVSGNSATRRIRVRLARS
ncbi:hypothetical protein GCM10023339_24180 [Alloalcanivorax gelatiniphagus]